jgi:hypothetical protein
LLSGCCRLLNRKCYHPRDQDQEVLIIEVIQYYGRM